MTLTEPVSFFEGERKHVVLKEYISDNVDDRTEVFVQEWKDADCAWGIGVPVLSENDMFLSDLVAPISN